MNSADINNDLLKSKIEISLKHSTGTSQKFPPNIRTILQNEYASKYLESIGANPSKENIEYVLNHWPIKDAIVIPAWVREKIIIVPDSSIENEDAILQHLYR